MKPRPSSRSTPVDVSLRQRPRSTVTECTTLRCRKDSSLQSLIIKASNAGMKDSSYIMTENVCLDEPIYVVETELPNHARVSPKVLP